MSVTENITAPYSAIESGVYDRLVAPAVAELRGVLWERFESEIRGTERVLDVGCGGGQIAIDIARDHPAASVTGVDLSAEQIERARHRARDASVEGRVQFVEGSALDLPFGNGQFDIVMSVASIKHWPDRPQGLSECARVLKKRGRLIVVEADRGCRYEDAEAFVQRVRAPRALRPLVLAAFRTWVAGRSLDLDDARTLLSALPLKNARAERIEGTPALLMSGTKR